MSPKTQPAQPKIQGADEHDTMLNEHIKAGVFARKGQPAQPLPKANKDYDLLVMKLMFGLDEAFKLAFQHMQPYHQLLEFVRDEVGKQFDWSFDDTIHRVKLEDLPPEAQERFTRAHLAPTPRPEDQLKPPVQPTLVEQCRTLAPLLGTLEKIKAEVYSDRKDHFRITAVKQLVDTALSAHPIPQAAPTAERVTSVITGLALDHFQARLKTTSGDLEALTSDIESVVQRALEASVRPLCPHHFDSNGQCEKCGEWTRFHRGLIASGPIWPAYKTTEIEPGCWKAEAFTGPHAACAETEKEAIDGLKSCIGLAPTQLFRNASEYARKIAPGLANMEIDDIEGILAMHLERFAAQSEASALHKRIKELEAVAAQAPSGLVEPITCPCGLTIKQVGNVIPLLSENIHTSSQVVEYHPELVDVDRLWNAAQKAREFIAQEYADPSQEEHGHWIAPEARPIHDELCEALYSESAHKAQPVADGGKLTQALDNLHGDVHDACYECAGMFGRENKLYKLLNQMDIDLHAHLEAVKGPLGQLSEDKVAKANVADVRGMVEALEFTLKLLDEIPESFIDYFMAHRHCTTAKDIDVKFRKDGQEHWLEGDWLKTFIPEVGKAWIMIQQALASARHAMVGVSEATKAVGE